MWMASSRCGISLSECPPDKEVHMPWNETTRGKYKRDSARYESDFER